ncbi:MAG: hypothetical protein K8T89_13930 [Planctomycetes bacterium]|nr:hypothetical protein [Planctomycetota bacterium]
MRHLGLGLFALVVGFFVNQSSSAQDAKWGNLKGQVQWQGPLPKIEKIVPGVNQAVCAMGGPLEESYIINPKNQGLANVFVWIRPTGAMKDDAFPKDKIHPALAKPTKPAVEIDQPFCAFIPHVLAAREGQNMIIKNSATIAHNAKWSSKNNGDINPLIAAGGMFQLAKPLVFEPGEIQVQCSIHGWMKAHVRVFDHPYFAVTDKDGNFEIPNAPAGKYNLFINHPDTGWLGGIPGRLGKPIEIKDGANDLGVFKFSAPKKD